MATTVTDQPESQPITLVDNSNPLRQFRSYSYHFFLVACESTTVLDYLSSPAATNAFERAGKNLNDPRDVITVPNVGKYVIVIDSRHDVDIIIEDVQWGTTFTGDQNSSNSSVALNVVMTDGTINFMEPRGVNFLNILANLGDQLDVDMICMPFCLKTVFYGHTESGQVIPLNVSQPLGFVPVDITGQVDERGTTYKMDICGVVNGVAHNPSYNAIVDNVSFPVTTGQNLDAHLATFTQVLNDTYTRQREIVLKETKDTIDLSTSASVVYNIQLEKGSLQLQKLNDFGSNITDQVVVENGKHIIKGTKEGGIPEVILKLLTSSKQWVQVAAQGDPPDTVDIDNTNRRYTFKVTQEFESSSPSVTKSQVTVKIFVTEYRYETVEIVSTPAGKQTQQPIPKIDPSQVVTFDYIFTGKNLDVLGMEINLSMGLALLQTLATAKSMSSQSQDVRGGQAPIPSVVSSASPAPGPMNIHGRVRKGTPIFAPLQWATDYLKEMNDIQNTATAEAIWKNFASYQSVSTSINIHGNPLLLAKIVDPNRSVPNYVKINIKMPNTPDDIWEYQLTGNKKPAGYYSDFWFTGYYLIVSAINKFQGGLFTQELDLVSLPQTSTTQGKSSAAIDAALANVQKAREVFFNTSSTAAPVSNAIPTAPVTPAPNTNTTGSLPVSAKSNPTSSTHQDFVANYWNYALQCSQSTGLAPDFALAQAAIETGWGTNSFCQNYSTFFNARAYGKPNGFWEGNIIPGTSKEAGQQVPPFRAYDGPTNSFLDQFNLISRLYPTAAGAEDINTYANGLINGKGNRKWDITNPTQYASNVIAAYNQIQTFKSNLGIANGVPYAGGPTPVAPGTQSTFLAVNTPTTTPGTGGSSTTNTYATNRTVAQAAVAQKATVFAA